VLARTWSFCFLLIYLAVMMNPAIKKPREKLGIILFYAILPILLCLTYETVALLLVLVSILLVTHDIRRKTKRLEKHPHRALLIASVVGLLLLFLSPATGDRASNVDISTNLNFADRIVALPQMLWQNLILTPQIFPNLSVLFVIFTGTILLLRFYGIKHVALSTAHIITACSIILISVISIALLDSALIWLGTGEIGPLRGYFIPTFLLIIATVLIASILYRGFFARVNGAGVYHFIDGFNVAISIMILVCAGFYFPYLHHQYSYMRTNATVWDVRDKYLKSKANTDTCKVYSPVLWMPGVADIQPSHSNWINESIRTYYGIEKDGVECGIYPSGKGPGATQQIIW
jgi:hypothetical protein